MKALENSMCIYSAAAASAMSAGVISVFSWQLALNVFGGQLGPSGWRLSLALRLTRLAHPQLAGWLACPGWPARPGGCGVAGWPA